MFQSVAQVDQVERLYAYRRIDDHPVYVSAALATGEGWAEWRGSPFGYGAAAMLAAALLVGLACYGLRAAAECAPSPRAARGRPADGSARPR